MLKACVNMLDEDKKNPPEGGFFKRSNVPIIRLQRSQLVGLWHLESQ